MRRDLLDQLMLGKIRHPRQTSPETFPLRPDDKPDILHHPFDILNKRRRSSASGPDIVFGEEARSGKWSAWVVETKLDPVYASDIVSQTYR